MAIRMTTALRSLRAQQIIDSIDAGSGSGTLVIMSGGRPDPDRSVAGMPAYTVSTVFVEKDYVVASGHFYRAENPGTSSGTAPAWPLDGSTVLDNDITWQDMGALPVLLGTLTLSDPCGTVTNGVVTFASIAEDSASDAGGIATWARIADSDGNPVVDMSVGVSGSGADIQLNTISIVAGGPLRITTATIIEGGA